MKLQLIYGLLLAVAAAPVVIALHSLAIGGGWISAGAAPNVSDYILAQFLNGHIQMPPTQFEALWMSRTLFTQEVATLGSVTGVAVAGFLAIGFCWFGLRLLRNALHVRGVIAQAYLWRRFGTLEIVLTDRVDVPFSTRGLRRRYIVLPSAILTQADDMRIAIAHEIQHMRQGDLGWEIILEALRPIFFWNPAFIFFKREVEEVRELACDQQILRRQRVGLRDYCDCLLRVCRNAGDASRDTRILVPSVPLVRAEGGKRAAKFLRRRVVSMLSERQLSPSSWITALIAVPFLTVISFGSVASQSSGDWSQDQLMLSTIVNLERLDQRTLATRY